MRDVELWVVDILQASDFAAIDQAQASWSRSVTRYRRDADTLAELAAITSIGRARWEEHADQIRTLTDARMERLRSWSAP